MRLFDAQPKSHLVKLATLNANLSKAHLRRSSFPSRVRIPSRFHQSNFSGRQRWQTFLFVRNQMDHTWSKGPSISTTPRETKSQLTIVRRSRSAGAELRQTNLSATARTARLVFKPQKQSTQRAPKLNPDFELPLSLSEGRDERVAWRRA